jgi:stage IV sporulation protein FB
LVRMVASKRFEGGWLHFRLAGVPTRIHWSTLPGAVFFGQFQWLPGFWIGFIVLILFHEFGHAAVAKLCGLPVSRIDVHGLGGLCWSGGRQSPLQRSLVAWGGVWAQLLVFIPALVLARLPFPKGEFFGQFLASFLWNNLILVAINLIPIDPLDGADAWKLPGLLRERWRRRPKSSEAGRREGPKWLGRGNTGADVIDLHERVREITEREARRVREEQERKRLQ